MKTDCIAKLSGNVIYGYKMLHACTVAVKPSGFGKYTTV